MGVRVVRRPWKGRAEVVHDLPCVRASDNVREPVHHHRVTDILPPGRYTVNRHLSIDCVGEPFRVIFVTSPYDIDEIFPQDAADPVRLPRRQAGNSPQGLAVTLLADYTLRSRAWLPSAAIVALLAEAG